MVSDATCELDVTSGSLEGVDVGVELANPRLVGGCCFGCFILHVLRAGHQALPGVMKRAAL